MAEFKRIKIYSIQAGELPKDHKALVVAWRADFPVFQMAEYRCKSPRQTGFYSGEMPIDPTHWFYASNVAGLAGVVAIRDRWDARAKNKYVDTHIFTIGAGDADDDPQAFGRPERRPIRRKGKPDVDRDMPDESGRFPAIRR